MPPRSWTLAAALLALAPAAPVAPGLGTLAELADLAAMPRIPGGAALATALGLGAHAGALYAQSSKGTGAGAGTRDSAGARGSAAAGAAADTTAARRLHPGDIVRLRIWREPDLSGEFPVDEDGVVVFPMIGPRTVTDISPDSLRRDLVAAFAVYLRHPSIDVVLLRRVNVLGAVGRPGLYNIDPTMTVADVLALAGGSTPDGDPGKVRLIRDGETITTDLGGHARVDELPIRSGDQFYVPERSWIARNSNIVAAAITATISLIIALTR